ncbi:MAG: inorganic phosphate transporter [Candidatus Heimdallarchaeota archaeon]|nr:inorganic phosphate transporter [Candidatus Heimdallarchaeota archaeon]MDH5645946.1 inorganic phosphate transporter [Candidatus Heimdallarchaeota archaeon]
MEDPLIFLTGVAMLLAIGIGANDETFAPLTGSKRLTVNQAVVMGGSIVIIGAVILGFKVAKTVGSGITSTIFDTNQILVILFSVSIALILGSWKGLPLSTTHAMVGATIALTIIIGKADTVNVEVVYKILASWIISPVIGFVGSFLVMKGILRLKRWYIKGLDDVDRLETYFSYGLLIAVSVTAFSRGGNDVSNAVAPILPSYILLYGERSLMARIPLFLGGICMAIGLIVIGRRVLKTLGNDIVELSPTTALSVQSSTAIVTFVAAFIGIPISGTHVLVSSFVGTGIAAKSNVNMNTVKKIAVSAVFTPIFSGIIVFTLWQLFKLWS